MNGLERIRCLGRLYIYDKAKIKIIYPTYEAFHTLIGFDFDFDDMKVLEI